MPTIKTISSPWPKALLNRETGNWAPAKSEVMATLCGRNRWLNEFLRGEFYTRNDASPTHFDNPEPPATPANPQGLTGLDHSGPPYGSALRHSVATYSSIKYASTNPLNDNRFIVIPPNGEAVTMPVVFYNKPFSPTETAPHSKGNLHTRVYNQSGTAGTVTFKISGAGPTKTLTTASVADGSTLQSFFNAADSRFEISSGLNVLEMEVSRSNSAASDFWLLTWDIAIIGKTGLVAF